MYPCQYVSYGPQFRDRSLFIPQGGTEEKLKKVYKKNYPTALGVFFTQPLIEIQDFRLPL